MIEILNLVSVFLGGGVIAFILTSRLAEREIEKLRLLQSESNDELFRQRNEADDKFHELNNRVLTEFVKRKDILMTSLYLVDLIDGKDKWCADRAAVLRSNMHTKELQEALERRLSDEVAKQQHSVENQYSQFKLRKH